LNGSHSIDMQSKK